MPSIPSTGTPSTQQGQDQGDQQSQSSADQGAQDTQQSGAPSGEFEDESSQNGGAGEPTSAEPEMTAGESSPTQNDNIDFSEEDPSSSSSNSESTQTASSQSSSQSQSNSQSGGQSGGQQSPSQGGQSGGQQSQSQGGQSGGQSGEQTASQQGGGGQPSAGDVMSEGDISGGAGTDSEQIAKIDATLGESMGTYDGMILREREYIQNRANQQGSEEEVAYVDQGALYDEAGEEGEGAGEEGSASQQPGTPDGNPTSGRSGDSENLPTAVRRGDYEQKGQVTPPPADIPSGHDDDVVARQIREAAMRETDAKLREKLWQEYRKYKNQK